MKSNIARVKILGAYYTVRLLDMIDDEMLQHCDGYTDATTHEIVVRRTAEVSDVGDYEALRRKSLRHEVIHAFLCESGLQVNFTHPDNGHDETMVDWFAIQYPKITKVFKELGIEEE